MNVPTRTTLVFPLLVGAFLMLTLAAIGTLFSLREPAAVLVAVLAMLACLVAAGITWLTLRSLQQETFEEPDRQPMPAVKTRVGVKTIIPPAYLPPAYVAAVMKGAAANRAAMKARADGPARMTGL